jgi:hypothetical protein
MPLKFEFRCSECNKKLEGYCYEQDDKYCDISIKPCTNCLHNAKVDALLQAVSPPRTYPLKRGEL